MNAKQPVGAVMVVGAGIGGMQASIDLANSGFKVYLVERDTAIGGRMAQLDKTFPTNDCAMCIISPKLIEVGRHPNIEILTNTELLDLGGDPGNFKAKVIRHPRYVDLEKCTGCGECAKVCPVELPNEYNMGMDGRRAIRKRYPQAIPGGYAIEKSGTAPCRDACPSNVRVQGYVALIAKGRFEEALKVIRRDLPFPGVCGRVCPHPCEDACNRGDIDDPIAIRELKRFVADYELKAGKKALPDVDANTGKSIAIVGGGPAGLSAAWFLRLKGHKVDVYESGPEAGGMLRTGIPAYRLPRDILAAEIKAMEDIGIDIHLNTKIGSDIKIDELRKNSDAMFIAAGAQVARPMRIPGEDLEGVIDGVTFLRNANLDQPVTIGKKVVVVGGGDVAMDVARIARRKTDGEITILYRRSRDEMPAQNEEIEDAEAEGIKVELLTTPIEAIGENGKIVALKCIRMELGPPDDSGRRRPVPIEGSEYTIEVDTLVPAIGQQVDTSFLDDPSFSGLLEKGWIQADKLTYQTNIEGIFTGGDMFTGPSIAIAAIAHGKQAAISIDRYLNGLDMREGRDILKPIAPKPKKRVKPAKRPVEQKIDPETRIRSFDEIAQVLSEEEAVAEAQRCLSCGICSECGLCEEACQAKAIDHDMLAYEDTLDIGSLVLAPGFDMFEAEGISEYGYGRWDNVITSMDFERLLSATGPTTGHIKRPSDNKEPKKVAWIQCVGSRDKRKDRSYCSSVCCMFATKEAVIATDHSGGKLATTIFMMDVRAVGKGFDDYCNRAQSQYGVRYVRSMISRVDQLPENKDIEVTYITEDGKPVKEQFDMLVLSTGLKPPEAVKELADRAGIELNEHGYAKTDPFAPMATTKPGVFVCGVFQGPKDIPETVAQASGAAAFASRQLSSARHTVVTDRKVPTEIDTESGNQRIGVWVCNCGINIGSIVDVENVAAHAREGKNIVHSEGVLFACSQDNQEHMKEIIKEKGLNRVVVASCTPRTHEPLFQDTLNECGLNSYLFSMANIREQCSWVHSTEPEKATEKAKQLVDMAIENAKQLQPLHKQPQSIIPRCMVIGGGLAGLTAALELADQGFGVTLIEKTDKLGGNLNRLRTTHDGRDVRSFISGLIQRAEAHENMEIFLNARLYETTGFLGNFESTIEIVNGQKKRIKFEHGTTIVAIGGKESTPTSFGYGESDAIITQLDLEQKLADSADAVKGMNEVVMIQCVGSRNDERPYCSKLCCSQALKNAIEIKRMSPETKVTILFREMRSYGMREELYAKAREVGVLFLRYDLDRLPTVTPQDGKVLVQLEVPRFGSVKIEADQVVLAAAIEPNDNAEISTILKLPRTPENFFLEVHQKLGPVDFASDGVYMAGLVHSPKPVDETISQAAAAAARAASVISKDSMMVGGVVSVVDPNKCAVCLCCVRACPYHVPIISAEAGAAYINPAECRGCGVCASECPGSAISLQHFTHQQIESMIHVLQEEGVSGG